MANKVWKVRVRSKVDNVEHSEVMHVSAFTAQGAVQKALRKAEMKKGANEMIVDAVVEYNDMESFLDTMKQ